VCGTSADEKIHSSKSAVKRRKIDHYKASESEFLVCFFLKNCTTAKSFVTIASVSNLLPVYIQGRRKKITWPVEMLNGSTTIEIVKRSSGLGTPIDANTAMMDENIVYR